MAKIKNDYFKLIENQVDHCVKAADYLEQILANYDPALIPEQRKKMHEIEHSADLVHHDITRKVAIEFITPIDQEDIVQLVHMIDEITDALDEVVAECYIYHIDKLPPFVSEFMGVIKRCVQALRAAAGEFKNFKKPEILRPLIIKVNDIESDGDAIYEEAMHKLFGSDIGHRELLTYKIFYDSLENCCDLCEEAADIMEQIMMKNT